MKDVSLIIYPAADLTAAKRFFRELIGTDPYADSPQYVGYRSGDMEIGLVPNGDKREPGALAYWTVSDIAASVKALAAAGARSCKRLPMSVTECWSPALKIPTARPWGYDNRRRVKGSPQTTGERQQP